MCSTQNSNLKQLITDIQNRKWKKSIMNMFPSMKIPNPRFCYTLMTIMSSDKSYWAFTFSHLELIRLIYVLTVIQFPIISLFNLTCTLTIVRELRNGCIKQKTISILQLRLWQKFTVLSPQMKVMYVVSLLVLIASPLILASSLQRTER